MHVRAVRFTDVSAERIEALVARIEESDGPPPGVAATGLTCCTTNLSEPRWSCSTSRPRRTWSTGAQAFSAMDPSETPGTRTSSTCAS